MISSKRYSTTGKVKPGICIIGQLPTTADKNITMTLYSMFKIKNQHSTAKTAQYSYTVLCYKFYFPT